MSNLKRFRLFAISSMFALLFFLATYPVTFAADYETPHTFEPGDVISADMMNEIFDYIRNAKTTITASDLVGTWTCIAYHPGFEISDAAPGWTLSKDGLIMQLENVVIVFTDDGDDTYSLSTSAPNPFYHTENASLTTNYELIANSIYIYINAASHQASYSLEKISETRIVCTWLKAQNSDTTSLLIFDKQNLPPAIPTSLSATASGLVVTLSWTDNSSDETGFKIIRKDTLTGTYSQIATAAANATSYSDTLSSAGTYWYRVKATNDNGDSLGSKEVKVTVVD